MLPLNVTSIIAEAVKSYRVRAYKPEDYEAARSIFTEGMMDYSPTGTNKRHGFHALDEEHAAVLAKIEEEYCEGFIHYVDYNLTDPNMARIPEYWSLARRSLFMVCEEIATGEVVGTVAIQPVKLCGTDDWYGQLMMSHVDALEKNGEDYYDNAAEEVGLLPSEYYSVDDGAYDPPTFTPKPTFSNPDNVTVKCDRELLSTEPKISETTPKRVPEGYYRRFQPQSHFNLPSPVDVNVYNNYIARASEKHTDIQSDIDNGTYTYETSMGSGQGLPPAALPADGYMEAEFRRMSVTKNHRKGGAAQLLLFTAVQTAHEVFGYDALHLSTSQTMDMAVKFYRKMGFREIHNMYVHEPPHAPWPIVHFKWDMTENGRDKAPTKYHNCGHVYSIGM